MKGPSTWCASIATPIDRQSLECPCGGIEDGEDPQEAARRELREEAGIDAEELIDLGMVDQLTEVVISPDRLFWPGAVIQEAGSRGD